MIGKSITLGYLTSKAPKLLQWIALFMASLLCFFYSGAFTYAQNPEQITLEETLKADSRQGFILSCVPTIESQSERFGLNLSVEQIGSYCTCVAIAIFDDMSSDEINAFLATMSLPERKEKARPEYSSRCSQTHLE